MVFSRRNKIGIPCLLAAEITMYVPSADPTMQTYDLEMSWYDAKMLRHIFFIFSEKQSFKIDFLSILTFRLIALTHRH